MFLDIGTGELLGLIVLAAVLLGPERVPPLAKKAAKIIRFLRNVANSATDQIKTELGTDLGDLGLDDLRPKNLIKQILPDDVQAEMDSLRAEMEGMRTEVARLQLQTGTTPRRPSAIATPAQTPTPVQPATTPAQTASTPALAQAAHVEAPDTDTTTPDQDAMATTQPDPVEPERPLNALEYVTQLQESVKGLLRP